MAAVVVTSTKHGQSQISDHGERRINQSQLISLLLTDFNQLFTNIFFLSVLSWPCADQMNQYWYCWINTQRAVLIPMSVQVWWISLECLWSSWKWKKWKLRWVTDVLFYVHPGWWLWFCCWWCCVFSSLDVQVKVLQLESQLEQERVRLGELRKRHYNINASEAETDTQDSSDYFPPPPPPSLLDSTPVPPSFSQTQPYLNTQSLGNNTNPFATTQAQPYSLPQSYTPTNTYSQAQSYTPPQSFTQSQSYTPAQSYTPSQPYTPSTSYPPSQPYIPPHSFTSNTNQSFSKPQSYSPAVPSSHTSLPPTAAQPQAATQSSTETTKPGFRKSNIFTKSGNLLKNAVGALFHTCSWIIYSKWLNSFFLF